MGRLSASEAFRIGRDLIKLVFGGKSNGRRKR